MFPMELHAVIHEEDGSYWAEVKELPGCFASGRDLEEIKQALVEAIEFVLKDEDQASPSVRIDELKLVTA
jgi:predicted RNase H-like HicB family nuclease